MKVLIYLEKSTIEPVGGPRGYVYNLKCGLEANNIDVVDFLDNQENNLKTKKDSRIKKMLKIIYKTLPSAIKTKRQEERDNKMLNSKSKLPENIDEYDIIHFHSTRDLYIERKTLENYKGNVVLTSHSPKPWHLEYIDDNYRYVKNKDKIARRLSRVDEYAFSKADYIIFPCKEAEEPYYNQWAKYADIHKENKNKYRYLPSGIRQCTSKISKKDIRKKYNIPDNSFVISYVGRHNEVKGYDKLLDFGKKVLDKYSDCYIIVAGKEGPLYRLNNERWIEVGWTKDPHSIISSSDIFILPNKETYFDLVFLEVLSLGIPIVASYTGGNKYFEKYDQNGIFLYKNDEEFFKILDKLKNCDNLLELGKENKKLYTEEFNEVVFGKNYIDLLKTLVEKK